MPITVVAGSNLGHAVQNGGNCTLTWPTLAQDDYAIVISQTTAFTPGTMVTSGYALLGTNNANGVNLWGKRMGVTPDASVQVNGNGSGVQAHAIVGCVFRGVDTTTELDVAITTANASSTNPDAPSTGSSVADGAMVVAAAASKVDDTSITAPSGYTNDVSSSANDTTSASAAIASKLVTPSGTENPPSWTNWSSGAWTTFTIALRPAAAAATVVPSLLLAFP